MLNLNNSIGAILTGAFVMAYLFGIVTVQTYQYYRKYPGDSLGLKILVASVWSLLLGHSIAVATGVFAISVMKFGQLSAETLATFPFPVGLPSSIMFSTFLAPIVQSSSIQGYFAYRIRVISKHTYIPALFWLDSLPHMLTEYAWLIEGVVVLEAVCDTLIALTMSYYLKRERSSALARTAQILSCLIKYTIETGALTSLTGLTVVICYMTLTNLVWFGVYLLLEEVYANALVSQFQHHLPRLEPHHSKDAADPVISDYATDGISPTPSVSPVQGIVIAVCQTKQVARDAHGAWRGDMHSAESSV
ncbi:hypothetical protein BJ138DRAFT_1116941 [Hygrophoropsis aurantiaca]|uniref:Uncharacterized protein n=1 Tax=Hygrophoropsis aurantiaca TaxID=72124 RepID=A0ACB8A1M6_9AGAM|nr:hypothetical protein BJ138DRAFT_1116941 [Hygrophoropsis aurantiaca]